MNIKDEVISLRNQGLSTVEIGKKVGKGNATIYRWLKKWGVYKSRKGFQPKEGHPNWEGGKSRSYIMRLSQNVLKNAGKDIATCWRCGDTKEDGKKIDIHHIDADRNNNDIYNLEALCGSCHRKEHHNRGDYFKTRRAI